MVLLNDALIYITAEVKSNFKYFDDLFIIMSVTIRGVDEKVFREFKAESVRKGVNLGRAITNAMRSWLEKERRRREGDKRFLDLKTFDWGEGTERSSVEVDKILKLLHNTERGNIKYN